MFLSEFYYSNILDAEHGLIVEMSAYFLGILFNVLLPLGVNTAREKVKSSIFANHLR